MTSLSSGSATVLGDRTVVAGAEPAADGRTDHRHGQGPAIAAGFYLLMALILATCGLGLIGAANRAYAPELYEPSRLEIIAGAFSNGQNYAVFDLNINIRQLRDEQISRLSLTPSLIILGASQWQEARTELLGNRHALNAHVHRDYYEDVLGVVEMLVRNGKLPRDLVITVRDRLFTPVAMRTDTLWLAGIPYYTAMAERLSLEPHSLLETEPLQRPRELISLAMLFTNAARWHNATHRPHPTLVTSHADLDLLRPDGSITWSNRHQAMFTQDRSRKLSIAHADASRNRPPLIDPKGVQALDTLLTYLHLRGVRVHLAHPPFNPIYFDRVQDTPYMEGLRQVEAVTRELAAKHKLGLVGSFDPADLGCTADMFIDAEHANADCLSKLMADVAASIDMPRIAARAETIAQGARTELRAQHAPVDYTLNARESSLADVTDAPEPPAAIARTTPIAGPAESPTVAVEPLAGASTSPPDTLASTAPPLAAEATVQAAIAQKPGGADPRGLATAAKPRRPAAFPSRRHAPAARRQAAATRRELVWPGDQPRTFR